jgi:hypothetical protein
MKHGLVAAEYALGSVAVERVPWNAADWVANGHDGPALRQLAGLNGTDTRLIGELLPDAPPSAPNARQSRSFTVPTDAARMLRFGEQNLFRDVTPSAA